MPRIAIRLAVLVTLALLVIQFFPGLAGDPRSAKLADFPATDESGAPARGLASTPSGGSDSATSGAATGTLSDGAAPRRAASILTFRSAQGKIEEFTLQLEGENVTLDGVPLPAAELTAKPEPLAIVLSIEGDANDADCPGGGYVHHLTEGGKTRTEKGCMSDPSGAMLVDAFKSLKSLPAH